MAVSMCRLLLTCTQESSWRCPCIRVHGQLVVSKRKKAATYPAAAVKDHAASALWHWCWVSHCFQLSQSVRAGLAQPNRLQGDRSCTPLLRYTNNKVTVRNVPGMTCQQRHRVARWHGTSTASLIQCIVPQCQVSNTGGGAIDGTSKERSGNGIGMRQASIS